MLPSQVRVKVSSEAAGAIAMAQVSVQTLGIRELVEQMLGVTGKEPARIMEILKRGSLVSGESRLRWEPLDALPAELAPILLTFPDSEPDRPFDGARCFHALLLAGRERLDLPRATAARRRLFRRRSFWDSVMRLAREGSAEYVAYSYRLRCDHYRVRLDLQRLQVLTAAAPLLRYAELTNRIATTPFDTLDLFVRRE